jgi:hypothetical protein
VFAETINPSSYYTFRPGDIPTMANTATPGEAAIYNNASALLGLNNIPITPSGRNTAQIGFNKAAFDAAAAPPIRPERHIPDSIATLRRRSTVALAKRLPRCPYCARKIVRGKSLAL